MNLMKLPLSIVFSLIFVFVANLNPLKSQNEGVCADALLYSREYIDESTLNETYLSWLKLIDQASYSQLRANGSVESDLFGSADFSVFNERRTSYFNSYGYNLSTKDAKDVVRSRVSGEALRVWQSCISQNSTGLYLVSSDPSKESTTVQLMWRSHPGATSPMRLSVRAFNVANVSDLQSDFAEILPNGSLHSIILYKNRKSPMRITVNGADGYSGSVYIAASESKILPKPEGVQKVYTFLINTGVHENAGTCEPIILELEGEGGKRISYKIDGGQLIVGATTTIRFSERRIGRIRSVRVTIEDAQNCIGKAVNDWLCDWIKFEQPNGKEEKIDVFSWFGDSYVDSNFTRHYECTWQ